jgi:hypothetical protein
MVSRFVIAICCDRRSHDRMVSRFVIAICCDRRSHDRMVSRFVKNMYNQYLSPS